MKGGKKQNIRKLASFVVFLLLLALGLVAWLVPGSATETWKHIYSAVGLGDFSDCADSFPASVHVLDVGKADSILVESGDRFLLVDGGTPDRGQSVVSYLKRRGVTKLDYVVNTHPDEDHIGGLKYVIDTFPIRHYLSPQVPPVLIPHDDAYNNTQIALKDKAISAETPKPGEKFQLGSLSVQVLGPLSPGNSTNNCSIVLLLTYQKIRFLLMGDAEKEEEQDLLASGQNLSADVLKVGHHGSSTSTTQALLDAVKPQYAAISVGWDSNKLPKKDVLNRLYDSKASIYRTDVSGTLIFLTDGEKITVKTEK